MNRKSNPWVALVALIVMLVLVVCVCVGCDDIENWETVEKDDAPRFIVERASINDLHPLDASVYVITDTYTGVQYLYFRSYNSGGLTVLVPSPEEETPKGATEE